MGLSLKYMLGLPCLHEGGKSLIYLDEKGEMGEDPHDYGLPVIIKIPKKSPTSLREIARLNNEYELTRTPDIPGVRKARRLIRVDDRVALILDYAEGKTLGETFIRQRKTLSQILPVMLSIVRVLNGIHLSNIIHKNINDNNIIIKNLEVTFIDFAIASRLDPKNRHALNSESPGVSLQYIAPEQTGRLDRRIDCRTDLYSLGVLFYRMLTGGLPFDESDTGELIHCHIARYPIPPCKVSPEIPEPLSDMVMKLLAKVPEDRYQSAWGLKSDLEKCLQQWQEEGRIDRFEPAQDDIRDRLIIPQKLYGREKEMQILEKALERVFQGKSETVLIGGSPGVGKTSLVSEIHKSVSEKHGYFVSGTHDRKSQTPYYGLITALSGIVNLLMSESQEELTLQKKTDRGRGGTIRVPAYRTDPPMGTDNRQTDSHAGGFLRNPEPFLFRTSKSYQSHRPERASPGNIY